MYLYDALLFLVLFLSSAPNSGDVMFLCVSSFYPQSLIPDIKPTLGQEAVVDLHPVEAVLSGAEDEDQECSAQNPQIRRTVTQVALQPILP